MSPVYYANGKLLLTAEYFVLDGAEALALPVKFGQSLSISPNQNEENLHWQSLDENGLSWFEALFHPGDFDIIKQNDKAIAGRLQTIFREIKQRQPGFSPHATRLSTQLSFPRNWGLGTSSTLIYLLAKWARVDPFDLQFKIFGGSGYDIACAGASGPIVYQKENSQPKFKPCSFAPAFQEQLYFIYLGKKQNSREGIGRYREKSKKTQNRNRCISELSGLTREFLAANSLTDFEKLITAHEQLIGRFIDLPRAKKLYFADYWGEIKSLGAWGGDFVLATSSKTEEETQTYFNEKGFNVFIPYKSMLVI